MQELALVRLLLIKEDLLELIMEQHTILELLNIVDQLLKIKIFVALKPLIW
jgi:hypothetical protein